MKSYEMEEIRKNWGRYLALGLILILLGIAVIGSTYYATVISMILLGIFLIGAGSVQVIQAYLATKWGRFFLSLFLGILYIFTGIFCLSKPATAAISITLWISAFLVVVGLIRMLLASLIRFDQWGWVFFNGIVTFLLGMMIYANWPISGLWVVGLFIGIDMILSGISWTYLSLSAQLRRRRR